VSRVMAPYVERGVMAEVWCSMCACWPDPALGAAGLCCRLIWDCSNDIFGRIGPLIADGCFGSWFGAGLLRESCTGAVQLSAVPGVTIYGPPPSRGRAALCSFNVEGLHATDISTLLDHSGAHWLQSFAG